MKGRYLSGLTLVLAVALALRLFAACPAGRGGGSRPAAAGKNGADVLFVVDGDTVKVLLDGREEWVRLLRIDTPERNETGYAEARAALRAMADGRTGTLVFETAEAPARDEYQRLLAYLFVDGRNLNVEMVRAGWSPFWTRYGEGRFARSFRKAETEARRAARGLWAGKGEGAQ